MSLLPSGAPADTHRLLQESPRFLAAKGRTAEALANLVYLRKEPITSPSVLHEMAEIEAAIEEERAARKDLGLKEAFLGKGNGVRFFIAFFIFFLQQWAGQNSVKCVVFLLPLVRYV
jgi:hypothetical protein